MVCFRMYSRKIARLTTARRFALWVGYFFSPCRVFVVAVCFVFYFRFLVSFALKTSSGGSVFVLVDDAHIHIKQLSVQPNPTPIFTLAQALRHDWTRFYGLDLLCHIYIQRHEPVYVLHSGVVANRIFQTKYKTNIYDYINTSIESLCYSCIAYTAHLYRSYVASFAFHSHILNRAHGCVCMFDSHHHNLEVVIGGRFTICRSCERWTLRRMCGEMSPNDGDGGVIAHYGTHNTTHRAYFYWRRWQTIHIYCCVYLCSYTNNGVYLLVRGSCFFSLWRARHEASIAVCVSTLLYHGHTYGLLYRTHNQCAISSHNIVIN